jgi:archaemetzincin
MKINQRLEILPIGDVDPKILEILESDLNLIFSEIEILQPIPLMKNSYNAHRDQYLSDDFLRKVKRMTTGYALGVTEVDLYTYNLNFVFGQAELPGRAAIISLNRLHDRKAEIFRRRMLIEAIHELGHTLGLKHCNDSHCVMHFSNSLEDTDIKKEKYCKRCWNLLPKI